MRSELKKMTEIVFFRLDNLGRKILWLKKEDNNIVKKNIRFHNIYKHKRCFILGNGPSLNKYDLSALKSEIVFCVNEFIRYDKIRSICPNYYVIADPKFFELDTTNIEDKLLIDKIRDLHKINYDIQLFVPINSRKVIEKYGWNKRLHVNYFHYGLIFDSEYNKHIDLARMIPSMQAVVQYAILIAIYMGFDEIYMLGTEQTNIFGNLKAFISKNEISDYAFEMDDAEREWKNKKLTEYSLPETLYGYAKIFELYDFIATYCQRIGVKIINCSPGTLIQGIPKMDYNDVISRKMREN